MTWKGEDRYFKGNKRAASDRARELVRYAQQDAEMARRRLAPNTRALQARHKATFEVTIEALILELWLCHLDPATYGSTLAVSRSKGLLGSSDDLKSPAINVGLPKRLDELEATGWLIQEIGGRSASKGARLTRLRPGPRLVDQGRRLRINQSDITRELERSQISIKAITGTAVTGKSRNLLLASPEGRRISQDLAAINQLMASLPLTMVTEHGPLEVSECSLHRVFNNGRLDHGGRFYGALWINMKDAERFSTLRLSGQPIVKLDFKSMQPRIAYALSGKTPPAEDIYHLPTLPSVPREALKTILLALFWDTKPRVRTPKGVRPMLPKGLPFASIRNAIYHDHAGLAGFLEVGRGAELLFHESEIMNRILLGAAGLKLPVLPVHDAVYCRRGDEQRVRELMESSFRDYTGGVGIVDIDYGPSMKRPSWELQTDTSGLSLEGVNHGGILLAPIPPQTSSVHPPELPIELPPQTVPKGRC